MPAPNAPSALASRRLGLRLRAGLAAGAAVAAAAASRPSCPRTACRRSSPRTCRRRRTTTDAAPRRRRCRARRRRAAGTGSSGSTAPIAITMQPTTAIPACAVLVAFAKSLICLRCPAGCTCAAHRRLRRVDDPVDSLTPMPSSSAAIGEISRQREEPAQRLPEPHLAGLGDQPAGRDRRGGHQDDQRRLADEHDQHVEERGRDDDQQRRGRRGRWPG